MYIYTTDANKVKHTGENLIEKSPELQNRTNIFKELK